MKHKCLYILIGFSYLTVLFKHEYNPAQITKQKLSDAQNPTTVAQTVSFLRTLGAEMPEVSSSNLYYPQFVIIVIMYS